MNSLLIALKVLHELAIRKATPPLEDIRALQQLAGNDMELRMPLDELACAIVHRNREAIRTA